MSTDFSRFTRIPSLPTVAIEAIRLAQDPNSTHEEFLSVIRKDPAIISRLLKAANTAKYASRGEVTDLGRAILLMGRTKAAALVLSFSLARQSMDSSELREHYERFWLRSFVHATAAEILAEQYGSLPFRGECYTVGILAGIGKLALLKAEPEKYHQCLQRVRSERITLSRAEQEIFGFSHGKLSSILLQQMGLPERCHAAIRAVGVTSTAGIGTELNQHPLIEIIRIADAMASLLCDENPGIAIVQLDEALQAVKLPSPLTAEQLLKLVRAAIEESSSLFQIDPARLPASSDILQDALDQLAQLAVEHAEGSSGSSVPMELLEENGRLKRRVADLLHVSRMDPLTGLCNRLFLLQELAERAALHRVRGWSLGMAVVDLDHFKKINDTWGHAAGDVALKTVAEVLRNTLRDSDLVGRYGGEEFVAILEDTTLPGLAVVGERLRSVIAQTPICYEGHCIPVTASIGLAIGRVTGNEADFGKRLFTVADAAMYRVKNRGRNGYLVESLECEFQPPFSYCQLDVPEAMADT